MIQLLVTFNWLSWWWVDDIVGVIGLRRCECLTFCLWWLKWLVWSYFYQHLSTLFYFVNHVAIIDFFQVFTYLEIIEFDYSKLLFEDISHRTTKKNQDIHKNLELKHLTIIWFDLTYKYKNMTLWFDLKFLTLPVLENIKLLPT